MNDVLKPAGHPNTNTRASFLKPNQPLRNTNHKQKTLSYMALFGIVYRFTNYQIVYQLRALITTNKGLKNIFLTELKIMKVIYIAASNYYFQFLIIIVISYYYHYCYYLYYYCYYNYL